MAKVTLSFAAWTDGNVAPGQMQVPIVATKTPVPTQKTEKPAAK